MLLIISITPTHSNSKLLIFTEKPVNVINIIAISIKNLSILINSLLCNVCILFYKLYYKFIETNENCSFAYIN